MFCYTSKAVEFHRLISSSFFLHSSCDWGEGTTLLDCCIKSVSMVSQFFYSDTLRALASNWYTFTNSITWLTNLLSLIVPFSDAEFAPKVAKIVWNVNLLV